MSEQDGFLEGVLKDMELHMALQSSKDKNGRINPFTASAIAFNLGYTSVDDTMQLGALLGSLGSFDNAPVHDTRTALSSDPFDWRELYSHDSDDGPDPERYATEEQYLHAVQLFEEQRLQKLIQRWHELISIGLDYDLDPELYDSADEYEAAIEEAKEKYAWRNDCEDGSEFDLDPDDYETEEECQWALEVARDAVRWRDNYESMDEFFLFPADYETEEEYLSARAEQEPQAQPNLEFTVDIQWDDSSDDSPSKKGDLQEDESLDDFHAEKGTIQQRRQNADSFLKTHIVNSRSSKYLKEEQARCQFIVGSHVTAADYLTQDGDFLYATAIQDHFSLSSHFQETEDDPLYFDDVMKVLAKKDPLQVIQIWDWCLVQFLPYRDYSYCCHEALTSSIISSLDDFPAAFKTDVLRTMGTSPRFLRDLVLTQNPAKNFDCYLVSDALDEQLYESARAIFLTLLELVKGKRTYISKLMDYTILASKNYDELETMEYVQQELLPHVKTIQDEVLQKRMAKWEKDIAKYIE